MTRAIDHGWWWCRSATVAISSPLKSGIARFPPAVRAVRN